MNSSAQVPREGRLLTRAIAALSLLTVLGLGLSCIRQQDEVLVRPEDPETTQQSDQQKR